MGSLGPEEPTDSGRTLQLMSRLVLVVAQCLLFILIFCWQPLTLDINGEQGFTSSL